MERYYLLAALLLCFFAGWHPAMSQTATWYAIYKLENKIGQEEAYTHGQTTNITLTANDRGTALKIRAALSLSGDSISYASVGNTSRFKSENIDLKIKRAGGFPLSENGSIKIRELLIAQWIKAGKPGIITSVINNKPIYLSVAGRQPNPMGNGELTAIILRSNLDELIWVDQNNKAVFLTFCDSEGDKREVIDQQYIPAFNALSQQSNALLIHHYFKGIDNTAKRFATIAITDANVIDLVHDGKIRSHAMLVLKNGQISYLGDMNQALITPETHVIKASGKFIIPGLWNMHTHLFHPDYLVQEIRSGVTSVRDMGNELDFITRLKQASSQGLYPVPDIFCAGLLDGQSANKLGTMLADDDQSTIENVKKYHDAGFDQIKVYSYVKKKAFNTIVQQARLYDMDVVGHLPVGYTAPYFIENGMNSISHIHYFMNSVKWGGNLAADNRPLIDKMLANKTYLDPTLNVYSLTGDNKLEYYKKLVKMFAENGIPIVAGTDNEGTVGREIQNYVDAGLSTLDALRTATIVPAKIMKAEAKQGSIATGKNAELLILDANPLIDIKTLDHVNTVIKGEWVIQNNP